FFDVDSDALAEQRANPGLRGSQIDVPAVELDWTKGAGLTRAHAKYASGNTHPLRTSVRLGTRLGQHQALDLRLRQPRPVHALNFYVPPEVAAGGAGVFAPNSAAAPGLAACLFATRSIEKVDDSAFVLLSSPESWNEEQPIRNDNSIPRYERPKDDAKRGTPLEKRRGPFPLAVAVEKRLPASWYPEGGTNRRSVRLAVIGQGHVFTGENLSPAREKLLLDTCNWLLGRDDLLAKDTEPWQYPRVVLSESENALWQWGTRLGLPLLFAYLGM